MDPTFSDWYRRVSISPTEDTLSKRWAAIELLLKKATADLIERALRVMVLVGVDPATALGEDFVGAFKEQDAAFPMRDNAEELRVLAGTFIHALMELTPPSPHSDLAGLGLVAAAFGTRDSHLPNIEHLGRARQFLHDRARSIRSATSKESSSKLALNVAHLAAIQQACEQNVIAPMASALPALFKELGSHLATIQSTVSHETEIIRARLDTQDEELKLLWWLQTSISRELGVPFATIGQAAPLILGSEVAKLVSQRPGPSFATDLLVQALIDAGHGETKASIAGAVNATTIEWRKRFVAGTDPKRVGALCPLAFAVACSLETDGADDWHPIYRKHCEIALAQPFPTLQLAAQFYNEQLFLEADR